MVINVIVEPLYKKTVWCKETLAGVTDKITSLRYKLSIITEITSELTHLIVIGTSPTWVTNILVRCSTLNIHAITVGCQPIELTIPFSSILIDYNAAITECISYLNLCKKNNIAMYGINRNSYSDIIKTKYFDEKNTYYIDTGSSLNNCFESFLCDMKKYDAVICANYICAVFLINKLKQNNISVPQDLYVVSYGDSIIGSLTQPSVTTVTLNHRQLGVQAVTVNKYLHNQDENVSLSVSVPCFVAPGASTNYMSFDSCKKYPNEINNYNSVFYIDENIEKIQKLESLLRSMKEIDFKIIKGLLDGKSYLQISDDVFISESSIKYRIKRMLVNSAFNSVNELVKIYTDYLGERNEQD